MMPKLHNHSRAGFTVIELVIGMAITTITLTALGAFTLSVATAWKTTEASSETTTLVNATGARLANLLRGARAAGAIREGSFSTTASPAAVMLWMQDANCDNVIQLLELEMLAYDPATKRVCRYQPLDIKDDENLTAAQFTDQALITRAYANFTPTTLAPRVEAMRLYKTAAGAKAGAIEAQLRIRRGQVVQSFSITTSLRSGVQDPT